MNGAMLNSSGVEKKRLLRGAITSTDVLETVETYPIEIEWEAGSYPTQSPSSISRVVNYQVIAFI
jgi:hypothetical protein